VKQVVIERCGEPDEVVNCVVLASPINPADLVFCRGRYREVPPLPATPGLECAGRVVAVGEGVADLAPGDLVLNLQRENRAQQRCVPTGEVIRLPSSIDVEQASMLRANPPTALLLLTDIVALAPGDWLIQNGRQKWSCPRVPRRPAQPPTSRRGSTPTSA
jgi:mitochondrial enoyl-[acyl-carrier protein] reductase / trans-2-enoyl-CoA reductase